MKTLFVYCDGGAINNPGPAGIGVIIKLKTQNEKLKTIHQISRYIGHATNNQAEYAAVIEALSWIHSNLPPTPSLPAGKAGLRRAGNLSSYGLIEVFLDSELVVNQLNLKYKVKNSGLQPLFLKVHNLTVSLGKVRFSYLPREKNREADRLVKQVVKKGFKNV